MIIKSMARKAPTFAQLIAYIGRDAASAPGTNIPRFSRKSRPRRQTEFHIEKHKDGAPSLSASRGTRVEYSVSNLSVENDR